MDTVILPPSPNWQLSKILACNDNGLLAYGSRGEVSILDLKSDGKFSVSFLHLTHKDKVNCLVFSPLNGKFNDCLATCGDDGTVRVWDYKKLSLLYSHSGHKDGIRVLGLDWSQADTNRLVSVNDLGSLVCWDLASNTIRRLHCGMKVLPICLACCPHAKDIVAIGCKGGYTLVVDVKGQGKIIHRLRGNEQDVTSISWCPVPFNVIKLKQNDDSQESGNQDLLLATGGLDKYIYIWRTGSDGRFEVILHLPNPKMRRGLLGMSSNILWTCVHWIDAYTLLSSSQGGELLSWDLNKVYTKNTKKVQPRFLHSLHHKGCFSIACPVIYNILNEEHKEFRNVWTTAIDKHMICTSLARGTTVLDLTTLGGIVYCMAVSPLDPNRLAIGSSDSKVFVWNTSDLQSFNLATHWKKIIGKVMSLCWHPTEEYLLAYGTHDGHIGLLDVDCSKPPTLLRLYLRKAVYRLCWEPPVIKSGVNGPKLSLFAVGDGDIYQFNTNSKNQDEEPKSLNLAVLNKLDTRQGLQKTLTRSDIAFKHDHVCFAVSSDNGYVYIINAETLELQHALYPHKKLINNLEWHPQTVACDNSISPYQHWLATSCEDIKVYDIPPDSKPVLVATLNGHLEKIVSLAWSPHFQGRLVSASYDCTFQVWDVPTQACLAVCGDHNMSVMCAIFSPQDPDIVISGSNDNTVRFISISKMDSSSVKPEKKKNRFEIALKIRTEGEEATELTVGMFDISQSEETSSKGSYMSQKNSIPIVNSVPKSFHSAKDEHKKRQKERDFFPVTSPQLATSRHFETFMDRTCSAVQSSYTSENTPSLAELGYLDFFGDDKAMARLLMVEVGHHIQEKQFSRAQQFSLWQGDVSQMVREAIAKKQLSDWLVSIAPLTGYDVWEEACQVYADQLVECGEASKASTYLLAIHKVHEAVQILVDDKLFLEAVAIAKSRLPSTDPLIRSVYLQWGESAKGYGQLVLAAHCFLAGGNAQASLEILSRIKELRWLRIAAQLAKRVGLVEQADSLALECLSLSISTGNVQVGYQLLEENPNYQYWKIWLVACESLTKIKNRSEKELFAWLEGHQKGHLSLYPTLDSTYAGTDVVYELLLPHLPTKKNPKFERDMWSYMSGQLAAACAARREASLTQFLRHTVSALSAGFHYQMCNHTSLALPLTLSLLAPNGLFAEGSVLLTECQSVEEKQLLKSLKAFACTSILHWMNYNWQKVSKLHFDVGEGMKFEMAWVGDLLQACIPDVLERENVEFIVKKAEKEQLQEVVNLENLQNKRTVKHKGVNNKSRKHAKNGGNTEPIKYNSVERENLAESKTIEESVTNNSSDQHKTINGTENKSTSLNSEHKKTSVSKIETNKREIKFPGDVEDYQNGINKSQDVSSEETGIDSETSIVSEENNGETSDSVSSDICNGKSLNDTSIDITKVDVNTSLNKLKELNEFIEKFEECRESVPNPFTAYMSIKYLLDNLVSKQDAKLAEQIHNTCDNLWKTNQQ